jgi:hypothetical protein
MAIGVDIIYTEPKLHIKKVQIKNSIIHVFFFGAMLYLTYKLRNMKFVFLFFAVLPVAIASIAQITEFPGYFHLGPNAQVLKVVTVPGCTRSYVSPAGTATSITHTTKLNNGGASITVESIVAPGTNPVHITADTIYNIEWFPDADGNATLYVDEKDKSVLYVNYGLNPKQVIHSGRTIEDFKVSHDCSGKTTVTAIPKSKRTVRSPYTVNMYKVNPRTKKGAEEMLTNWFLNSDRIVVYSNAAGGVDYYLVNRYDRNGKYILQLQNREHIAYNHRSVDVGALTIPFKYRFGYNKNGIEIKDDVIAGFNIGAYAGYKITRSSIINKKGTYILRNFTSLRVGPFINLSSATVDSLTTTTGAEPLQGQVKQNIAVLSPGAGIMVDVRGVQAGFYGGWDIGMGAVAHSWNYQERFWIGFGLGYKLTDLFAKKD